ncbi:hypothetical protein HK102_011257 [Quaeritorhiza haematococci]|nr:hypothetical protein HK102_011257 [Quaeritorhiza haematococci]
MIAASEFREKVVNATTEKRIISFLHRLQETLSKKKGGAGTNGSPTITGDRADQWRKLAEELGLALSEISLAPPKKKPPTPPPEPPKPTPKPPPKKPSKEPPPVVVEQKPPEQIKEDYPKPAPFIEYKEEENTKTITVESIEPILKMLSSPEFHIRVEAMGIIKRITADKDVLSPVCQRITECLISRFDDEDYIVAGCCAALANLASRAQLRGVMKSSNLLPKLIEILQSYDLAVLEQSLRTLQHFMSEPIYCDEVFAAGGLKVLRLLVHSSNESIRQAARFAYAKMLEFGGDAVKSESDIIINTSTWESLIQKWWYSEGVKGGNMSNANQHGMSHSFGALNLLSSTPSDARAASAAGVTNEEGGAAGGGGGSTRKASSAGSKRSATSRPSSAGTKSGKEKGDVKKKTVVAKTKTKRVG